MTDTHGWRQPRPGLWAAVLSAWLLFGTVTVAAGQGDATAPVRVADYTITATYEPRDHVIIGHEVIHWRNPAPVAAPDLFLHLYLNAFADSRSTMMRGLGAAAVAWAEATPPPWGYVSVDRVRIGDQDRTAAAELVQPDDGNVDDRTVLRVPLEAPVPPGGDLRVTIDFVAKLPRVLIRTGHAGPFTMAAQWFPKLGVFGADGWTCHQYHATTEFFADFGRYDVTLTLPASLVVGASGTLVDERANRDGTQTLHFVADPVIDFAWAADPRFDVTEETIDGIRVRLLLQPAHAGQRQRYLGAARAAIEQCRARIGTYPFALLTVVDPGPGAIEAGGMEYPTLITVGTTWGLPDGIRLPELVTVHEFGHQYWYGLIATNEAEEAWLDEGINSYFEGRIMDATYGLGSYLDCGRFTVDSVAAHRLEYLLGAGHDPITRPAWLFLDGESYRANTYAKTALALETLGRLHGVERLDGALAAYFREWEFRHPRGKDFRDAIRAGLGNQVDGTLGQLFDDPGILDYAVTRVTAAAEPPLEGYAFTGTRAGEAIEAVPDETAEPRYRSEVIVERLGSVVVPVAVEVTFDDGTHSRMNWDGRGEWTRVEFRGTHRVVWAEVDPDHTLVLDANWLNNSRMRVPATRGMVRLTAAWTTWMQAALHLLTGL